MKWVIKKKKKKKAQLKTNFKTAKKKKKKVKTRSKTWNKREKNKLKISSVPVLFCELDPWPASLSWGSSRAPQTPQYLLQSDSNPAHPHG